MGTRCASCHPVGDAVGPRRWEEQALPRLGGSHAQLQEEWDSGRGKGWGCLTPPGSVKKWWHVRPLPKKLRGQRLQCRTWSRICAWPWSTKRSLLFLFLEKHGLSRKTRLAWNPDSTVYYICDFRQVNFSESPFPHLKNGIHTCLRESGRWMEVIKETG